VTVLFLVSKTLKKGLQIFEDSSPHKNSSIFGMYHGINLGKDVFQRGSCKSSLISLKKLLRLICELYYNGDECKVFPFSGAKHFETARSAL
jgi:hypothetical protein